MSDRICSKKLLFWIQWLGQATKIWTSCDTKFASPFAFIFIDELETKFLKSQELISFLWLGYIDNIFFIWTHGEVKLTQFLNELNKLYSRFEIYIWSFQLDVLFSRSKCKLKEWGDIYIKLTDSHQYLHYQSSHPLHIKTSVPYSQTLRVSRICSSEKDFKTHVSHLKEWFLARGYWEIVVNNEIDKLHFGRDQSFNLLVPPSKNLFWYNNWGTLLVPLLRNLFKLFWYHDFETFSKLFDVINIKFSV